MKTLLCSFIILTTCFSVSMAATHYIKADGTGDFATVQAGINAAVATDTVLLAAGTYTGLGNRDIDFLGKAITVTSESGLDVTIIDCQSLGRGFYFHSGEGPASVVSGLTIQNGSATRGGGIYCFSSSPTISNNTITGNSVTGYGGGICCWSSSPTISNNTITGNSASLYGGGIFCNNSSSTISNNTITGNSASTYGGGIYCNNSSPTITNNTLSENSAPLGGGGGIYCFYQSSPTIENTIIAFSSQGEGVYCASGGNPTITCCDIFGNAGGDALCGTDGGDNISSDPLFCGPDDYRLDASSPCAPVNSPCGVLVGAWPVACGGVAAEESTWGSMKSMYGE